MTVTPYLTCNILSHASVKEKRKRKEKKRILNIDLAARASQWLREAVYDRGLPDFPRYGDLVRPLYPLPDFPRCSLAFYG